MSIMWLYFINLFFIVPIAICDERIPCEFNDEECLTAAYKILFKEIVVENSIYKTKSSDPMYKDKIEVFLPRMNLTLTEVYMHGTKSCEVDRLRINSDDWFANYICPKMVLNSDYEINGDIDSFHIEGKGRCEIIYEKYNFGAHGLYDLYIGKNGKEYIKVKSYEIDFIDVQGSAVYNFTNLFNGDVEKALNVVGYLNKNWRKLNDIIGEPIIYSLFGHFINNVNNYLSVVPKLELFYKA